VVNQSFQFALFEGLPSDYGTYLFLLKNGSVKQGYYGSFPHPHCNKSVRFSDCEYEEFDYEESSAILGWLEVSIKIVNPPNN
jgi:hypothetical protein